YMSAGMTMMSFKPINATHQHLCAFHVYSYVFLLLRYSFARKFTSTHLNHDFHQGIIYDSDKANTKLIGIEYIFSGKIFASLPAEEKKFRHSRTYEIESGLLQMQARQFVPSSSLPECARPSTCNNPCGHTMVAIR
ncbi:uncharacterized protein LAESUDRAFT_646807, partial [Laetiporus sulphureus 93-53]